MRKQILIYHLTRYLTLHPTLHEITIEQFRAWLREQGDEGLADLREYSSPGDIPTEQRHKTPEEKAEQQQYLIFYRLFKTFTDIGFLRYDGEKTPANTKIYTIVRAERDDAVEDVGNQEKYIRALLIALTHQIDYLAISADRQNAVKSHLTDALGLNAKTEILKMADAFRLTGSPFDTVSANAFEVIGQLNKAMETITSTRTPAIAPCAITCILDENHPQITDVFQLYPMELQLHADLPLLFASSLTLDYVCWIPVHAITEVEIMQKHICIERDSAERRDLVWCRDLLKPVLFEQYNVAELLDVQQIEMEFDEVGWRMLSQNVLPAESDMYPEEHSIVFEHPTNENLVRWVLQFGRHARVMEPEILNVKIREEVRQMAAFYDFDQNMTG